MGWGGGGVWSIKSRNSIGVGSGYPQVFSNCIYVCWSLSYHDSPVLLRSVVSWNHFVIVLLSQDHLLPACLLSSVGSWNQFAIVIPMHDHQLPDIVVVVGSRTHFVIVTLLHDHRQPDVVCCDRLEAETTVLFWYCRSIINISFFLKRM